MWRRDGRPAFTDQDVELMGGLSEPLGGALRVHVRNQPLSGAAVDHDQEITRLIARGAGTAEIAAQLYLSRHTVRDHVKAILHKVRVSSRGELVAKLFAEHYEPGHASDVVRVETGRSA